MTGRQSHGATLTRKTKHRIKSKKRSQDALSIASHEIPDNLRIKQHRLGAQEGRNRQNKRRRYGSEDREEEEDTTQKKRKFHTKERSDEPDLDEGSDSEGNKWKLGQVDSDDDSDLDSDEAFGESDEERFDGFVFPGSFHKKSKRVLKRVDINLDEDDADDTDLELEDGDLGEDAVDLAAMMDMSDSEDNTLPRKHEPAKEDSDSADEGNESDQSDSAFSIPSQEDDETADPEKIAALQNLIANFSQTDKSQESTKQRTDGVGEHNIPSDFGLNRKTKLKLEDLGLSVIQDTQLKKSLKFLESNGNKINAKLDVPLAKRQQDRLDRSAAYEKSKETLDRWTDTVKHNRRADHIMFPLVNNDLTSSKSNKHLVPTNLSKPHNELEAAIQSILEESGLATANGKDDEDRIREFEELESNKLSFEDVKARRDQLRMARALLFREEAKSKRIKKIKSKSYRRVHRKQREKEAQFNQQASEDGSLIPSVQDVEAQERKRAEERMGAKHRGSKWAKSLKETGRAAWDEDARSGVAEMAQRDEELRKRVEGKTFRIDQDDSDDSDGYDDDNSEGDGSFDEQRLLQKLESARNSSLLNPSLPGGKLASMEFMRKAEASRKKENDDMVQEIRRELVGEDMPSESEKDDDIGRRVFGPGINTTLKKPVPTIANEFEERSDSEERTEFFELDKETNKLLNIPVNTRKNPPDSTKQPALKNKVVTGGGAWSGSVSKSATVSNAEARRRWHKDNISTKIDDLDMSKAVVISTGRKPHKTAKDLTALEAGSGSDSEDEDEAPQLSFSLRNQDLIKRAFAGADVVGEFTSEKRQIVEDEGEKIFDNAIPGWGNWTGDGVSKREKSRNKGKFLTKVEGIRAQDRKDSKLSRVIINEKRVKKNTKYLATSLPYPYETRQQYERALRLPIGPEWTTKETFQDATKPRILLKQGVIAPISKPLL